MALADYYSRSALAASQVLAGFEEQRFRTALQGVRVGVAIGADAADGAEGQALVDLLIRLLARLYPTLVIRCEAAGQAHVDAVMSLARRVNPSVEFAAEPTVEVAVGMALPAGGAWPRIFAGSDGWNAMVATECPRPVGHSDNPFGPGMAASLAAANLFRCVFLGEGAHLDTDVTFSVLEGERRCGASGPLTGSLGEISLIGAGAIGNAVAWALSRAPMGGVLHVVDPESIDLGNLQRYVLCERGDEGGCKVEVLSRHFAGALRAVPHVADFAAFATTDGHAWPRMLLALDSARDRRAAQASLPRWIANAWTQPGDLGVSVHDFLGGACVACLYLPDHALEHEDALIAASFGVPERLMQIRVLLYKGEGVPRDLLEAIGTAREIPFDQLLPFEGRPVRALYTEGFCGGAVIPMGKVGTPRQDVHVPLAHQSAAAGLLLAAAAIRDVLGHGQSGTLVTRLDVLRPVGLSLTQSAAKDPRGICICQDADYQEVYRRKYGRDTEA